MHSCTNRLVKIFTRILSLIFPEKRFCNRYCTFINFHFQNLFICKIAYSVEVGKDYKTENGCKSCKYCKQNRTVSEQTSPLPPKKYEEMEWTERKK